MLHHALATKSLVLTLIILSRIPALAQPLPFQTNAQPQLTARLDSFFHTLPANQPGIALSIEKHGEILYQKAAGLADLNTHILLDSTTNFRMASLTKQFTAMAILLLEKNHRLTVDDPIGHWLPELPANIGRHISGFCLLALIIERASHEPYAGFIKDHIFIPLHMDHSTIYVKGHPIFHRAMGYAKDSTGTTIPSDQSVTSASKGDGGVYTSLADYRKWILALRQNRLINLPATLRRLQFPIENRPATYYAAGWFIGSQSPVTLFHSGSTCGFATYIIQIPADDWSITYFSNLADNQEPFRQILRLLKASGMPDLAAVVGLQELTR
jgi:CubicO group peptidase (beta-lactamase class C family)